MSTSLPERPDLDQLRRQAKELRDAVRNCDTGAAERFARHHPSAPQGVVTLAAAQLVIARELGFASWPQLKAAVEAGATTPERQAEMFVQLMPKRSSRSWIWEVWSKRSEFTYPPRLNGETTSSGTRKPSPMGPDTPPSVPPAPLRLGVPVTNSPAVPAGATGGGTWSKNPPFSS